MGTTLTTLKLQDLEDAGLRFQFNPIPDVYGDYAILLSYGCLLLRLIIVHLFTQDACLVISGVF